MQFEPEKSILLVAVDDDTLNRLAVAPEAKQLHPAPGPAESGRSGRPGHPNG